MVPALKAVIGDEQAVIYSVNMHVQALHRVLYYGCIGGLPCSSEGGFEDFGNCGGR